MKGHVISTNTKSPPAESSRRTYFREMDGVRAVAILMVMLFHLNQDGLAHIPGPIVLGQTGVDLFFVLSGFLITGILLKAQQHDWHEIKTFYIRRSLRIFPIYYLTLALIALAGTPATRAFYLYLQNLPSGLVGPIQGPAHFWSLAVEEQFYLVWPFVVLFTPRKYLKTVLVCVIVAVFVSRFPLILMGISPFTFTTSRADALAAGGLLALLLAEGRLTRYRGVMSAIALLSAAGLMVEQHFASAHSGLVWEQATKFSLLAFFYASAMGVLLVSGDNVVKRLLSGKVSRFIGRISYGLYVYHPFVFAYIGRHFNAQPALLRTGIALAATFVCALLSWYVLERYLIGLKDKIAPERARFPARAPEMTSI